MEPVIRMFTNDAGTVRWITTMAGGDRLAFSVSGPDDWHNSSFFTDPMALVRFQAEYERVLPANSYSVSLVNDRRWRGQRREWPRPGEDRRK